MLVELLDVIENIFYNEMLGCCSVVFEYYFVEVFMYGNWVNEEVKVFLILFYSYCKNVGGVFFFCVVFKLFVGGIFYYEVLCNYDDLVVVFYL